MLHKIAIIGRPNVGKSTLFNKLIRKKLAIVHDTPGVTRDWREAEIPNLSPPLILVDTAGLEEGSKNSLEVRMRGQTERALKQNVSHIIMVIDGREGLTPLDRYFASWLRKLGIPVSLAVNKCDDLRKAYPGVAEAYELGLGDPYKVSSEHNIGIYDLLHDIHTSLYPNTSTEDPIEEEDEWAEEEITAPPEAEVPEEERAIHLAIIGRPNVGKSTLLNAILKEERALTGPEAGLTRDSIVSEWDYKGKAFRLVDTAGLRKKSKISEELEILATQESMRAIRLAHLCILVLDATHPLEDQDLTIASHVVNEGRALIIALNKWDLAKNKTELLSELDYQLEKSLPQVKGIPYVTISALHHQNLDMLFDQALDMYDLWNRRISTNKLNVWLNEKTEIHPPPMVKGKRLKLKYMTQVKHRPPTFAMWTSLPEDLPGHYKNYLINQLREDFQMPGVPIRLMLRKGKNPFDDGKKRR